MRNLVRKRARVGCLKREAESEFGGWGWAEPEKLIQAATSEGVTISMVLTTHKHWYAPWPAFQQWGAAVWRVCELERTPLPGMSRQRGMSGR